MDWLVKIKSIQEADRNRMCVGSDISWLKLCKDVRASKCVPSSIALSSFHQDEYLPLMSAGIIVRKELCEAV